MLDINVAQVLITFIVLLFSLTIHETAHAWTADRLGDPTGRLLGRISLNPIVHIDPIGTLLLPLIALGTGFGIIGFAKPVPVKVSRLRHPRRDFVLVAAAGPASNLLLALLSSVALAILPVSPLVLGEPNVSVPIASFLNSAIRLNVFLAVFNMMPIPPLDGGNVLAGLLPLQLARQFDRIRPYGILLIYALMLTDGYRYLVVTPSRVLLSWLPS